MSFFTAYIKEKSAILIGYAVFCFIFIFASLLYKLPVGASLYPAAVCTALGIAVMASDCKKAYKKHQLLENNKRLSADLMEYFPKAETMDDADYLEIIELIRQEQKQRTTQQNIKYADMVEYYTIWAHQIKTPIAAMSLKLQNEDSELSRSIADDLSRIEQYVEMVLMFLRLDSDYSDYVIAQYKLDSIVKEAVKRFAPQFINKKIRLDYHSTDITVLTDKKWLLFVTEQVLSNAIKYTLSVRPL